MRKRNSRPKPYRAVSGVLLTVTLLVLPLLSLSCALLDKGVTVYPIEGSDIVLLNQGETLVAPKQGAFLSDFYMTEIMEAKVK